MTAGTGTVGEGLLLGVDVGTSSTKSILLAPHGGVYGSADAAAASVLAPVEQDALTPGEDAVAYDDWRALYRAAQRARSSSSRS